MSVTAAAGFEAAGVAAGIKASGRPDLALVATADRRPVTAAGVFTTNLVAAAPVVLSRRHLLAAPQAAAVVLNSGNANAATGRPGLAAALATAEAAAAALRCGPTDVLVCSTGLIGIPMAPEPITAAIPALAGRLAATPDAGREAAVAIMTTDTVPKEAVAGTALGGRTVTVGAMAKGAAMLSPAMATMLCVITTDASVTPPALQRALTAAVEASFNRLSTDGARSTNDTVLALAGGAAGNPPVEPDSPDAWALTAALTTVCASLADQMAADAEGATKLVRITVTGARSDADAARAARAVADSALVKSSLYGSDPYWGRVLSEIGACGIAMEPERVDIAYNGITICVGGIAAPAGTVDADALAATMKGRDIAVTAALGLGFGEATVTTVDLSPTYIHENMTTS